MAGQNDVTSVIREKLKLVLHRTENSTVQSVGDLRREVQVLVYVLNHLLGGRTVHNVIDFLNSAMEEFDRINCVSSDSDVVPAPKGEYTKLKGRPKLYLPPETVEFYIECGFGVREMAQLFGVSKRTSNRRLSEMNIDLTTKFANIPDDELDKCVQEIINEFPNSGYRTVKSHLACRGLLVQEERVQESLKRIDLEGVLYRQLNMKLVLRRKYSVRAPLSLWHIDGYHKLIRLVAQYHHGVLYGKGLG